MQVNAEVAAAIADLAARDLGGGFYAVQDYRRSYIVTNAAGLRRIKSHGFDNVPSRYVAVRMPAWWSPETPCAVRENGKLERVFGSADTAQAYVQFPNEHVVGADLATGEEVCIGGAEPVSGGGDATDL